MSIQIPTTQSAVSPSVLPAQWQATSNAPWNKINFDDPNQASWTQGVGNLGRLSDMWKGLGWNGQTSQTLADPNFQGGFGDGQTGFMEQTNPEWLQFLKNNNISAQFQEPGGSRSPINWQVFQGDSATPLGQASYNRRTGGDNARENFTKALVAIGGSLVAGPAALEAMGMGEAGAALNQAGPMYEGPGLPSAMTPPAAPEAPLPQTGTPPPAAPPGTSPAGPTAPTDIVKELWNGGKGLLKDVVSPALTLNNLYNQATGGNQPGTPSSSGNPFAGTDMGSLLQNLSGLWASGKYGDDLSSIKQGLEGLYQQNSPYAQQLRSNLQRQDAARGMRSNYAGREVELQAKLAESAARMAPTLQEIFKSQLANRQSRVYAGMQGASSIPYLQQLWKLLTGDTSSNTSTPWEPDTWESPFPPPPDSSGEQYWEPDSWESPFPPPSTPDWAPGETP